MQPCRHTLSSDFNDRVENGQRHDYKSRSTFQWCRIHTNILETNSLIQFDIDMMIPSNTGIQ